METRNGSVRILIGVLIFAWLSAGLLAAQTQAYIANSGDATVSIVQPGSYEVIASIPVAASPAALAVSPDGKKLYVVSAQPEGRLSIIDLETRSVIATIDVGLEPSAVAVGRDGTRVYVSNSGSNSISVIDATTLSLMAGIPVGERPRGLALTPDGTRLYVANCLSRTVSEIQTGSNTELAQIPVGSCPTSVTIDVRGARAFVANQEDGSVSTLDLVSHEVTDTMDAGSSPEELSLSLDGSRLYVANTTDANFVSVFDTRSRKLIARIGVLQPRALASSPEGGRLLVTSQEEQSVMVIDAVTNQVLGRFFTGAGPRAATLTPPSAVLSGIEGMIMLGPNCPIYRDGDLDCAPRSYQASIIIKNEDRSQVITGIRSDENGKFSVSLQPGQYWVEMPDTLTRIPYLKPTRVTVPANQYTPFTVFYDTGIR